METIARITKNSILTVPELISQMSQYLPSTLNGIAIEDGISDHQLSVLLKISDEQLATEILNDLRGGGFGVEVITKAL